ncbi:hypothetical protein MTP99_014023 [Tenebrio molitor]|nr:hypothetical protein MTP99_014023 [Tenebrio molitor]
MSGRGRRLHVEHLVFDVSSSPEPMHLVLLVGGRFSACPACLVVRLRLKPASTQLIYLSTLPKDTLLSGAVLTS